MVNAELVVREFYGNEKDRQADLEFNYGRFLARLRNEWRKGWQVAIVIDGSRTGVGKSSAGMQLALDLDPRFGLDHIAFRGRELEPLYATLPEWSVVQLDEPRDLMASKGTRDRELLHIAAALGSVRKNRIATILIAPKKELFDSLITNGLASYWLFMERRGVGRLHRAWTGATYKKSQSSVPYDRTRLEKIGFRNLDGDPLFERYVTLAVQKNRDFFGETRSERRAAPAARPQETDPPTGPDRHSSGADSPSPSTPCRKCTALVAAGISANLRTHLASAHGVTGPVPLTAAEIGEWALDGRLAKLLKVTA